MREIKFRGRRTDGCMNWVYGSLVTEDGKRCFIISSFEIGYNSTLIPVAHLVIPNTVSQSTGLQDKNGVDIYEGDIVETMVDRKLPKIEGHTYEDIRKAVTKPKRRKRARWTVEHVSFMTYHGYRFYGENRRFNIKVTPLNVGKVEVIGNIHEGGKSE